jgi:peroxiredoxin
MKRIIVLATLVALSAVAQAALKPGAKLQAYEIKNTATGEKYCQVCKYGPKDGKIVAFGKLKDEKFWADLKELQGLQSKYEKLGVFAQVIDSDDAAAIQAAAKKNGITFPIVTGTDDAVDKIYKVNGESRVIYYAKKDNKIVWSNVGLEGKSAQKLSKRVAKDLKG